MKCPICGQETAGQDVQRWGSEFAHARCVMAYSLGGADARMEIRERIERLHAIEAAARNLVKVKGRYHTEQELEAITGYRTASRQLQTLHARGFSRAYRNRQGKVVLERPHYDAVCRGEFGAGQQATRPAVNTTFLKRAA